MESNDDFIVRRFFIFSQFALNSGSMCFPSAFCRLNLSSGGTTPAPSETEIYRKQRCFYDNIH